VRDPTPEQIRYVRACLARAHARPVMGQCFWNSRRLLVLGDPDRRLQYVEGYTAGGTHHAWLTLDDAALVDVTLRALVLGVRVVVPESRRWLGPLTESDAPRNYFGVPFTLDAVVAEPWRSRFGLIEFAPQYRPNALAVPWSGS
jgi:hypothetical protein